MQTHYFPDYLGVCQSHMSAEPRPVLRHDIPVLGLAGRTDSAFIASPCRRWCHSRARIPYLISSERDHDRFPVQVIPIPDLLREKGAPLRGRGQDCVVEPVT